MDLLSINHENTFNQSHQKNRPVHITYHSPQVLLYSHIAHAIALECDRFAFGMMSPTLALRREYIHTCID